MIQSANAVQGAVRRRQPAPPAVTVFTMVRTEPSQVGFTFRYKVQLTCNQ
ncbi:hypothetical protein SAMN04487959_105256 [Modicisalibacter xianhensis]|uniref:Uncharacterized protein n=1 Tax=Modicisalibacter xianhensis TaxID=442341 RepID=A0A1I3AZI7_9GAMM|nr:hypothetical protein SAMN04487959_105256 [Halomonas xianhensis]